MSRRSSRRDTALAVLKAYHLAGKILDKDMPTFEMIIRRCRTPDEYHQVNAVLHHYMEGYKTEWDHLSLVLRDEVVKSEEAD